MIRTNVSGRDGDALKKVREAIGELKSLEALVGIPAEAAARENDDTVNNAELLFIHTNGSPKRGIPRRPVLEPAIEHGKDWIVTMLKKAAGQALDGNKEGVKPALEQAGIQGAVLCQEWFDNPANGWAPNTSETIEKKGSAKPLVDTAEMRKHITYKVAKK